MTKKTNLFLCLLVLMSLGACSSVDRIPAREKNVSDVECLKTSLQSGDLELYWKIANNEKVKNKLEDLCVVKVLDLRPTQFAVGMVEVERKREKFEALGKDEQTKYMKKNPEPIVIGPKGEFYIIDHHHLARTLFDSGTPKTYGIILESWYGRDEAAFWSYMIDKNWVYLHDENGAQKTVQELLKIKNISQVKDDPYRSLAGQTRCKEAIKCLPGQWLKTEGIPFIEFKWAQFFRENANISSAMQKYGAKEFHKVVEVAHQEILKMK